MKILVMGGTTFVSKCFAMYAIEKGYTVDIFTRGKIHVDYEGVDEHLIGDRKKAEDLKRLIKKPYDYVVDISAYCRDDVKLLLQFLDTSRLKRYVMCSTISVYKSPEVGGIICEDSSRGFDEEFGGEYGDNKNLAEEYLMDSNIPVTIFRPTYIYGEHNNIFREAFLFESIERGKVNSLDDQWPVQFVYIWDLVKTFESCFHIEKSINQAYNVANPEELKWSEWIEAGFKAMDKRCEVSTYTEDELEEIEETVFPFWNMHARISVDKLIKHGLYVPNTSIDEGMKKSYEWYEELGEKNTEYKRKFDIK